MMGHSAAKGIIQRCARIAGALMEKQFFYRVLLILAEKTRLKIHIVFYFILFFFLTNICIIKHISLITHATFFLIIHSKYFAVSDWLKANSS